jgi:hypothetical protein
MNLRELVQKYLSLAGGFGPTVQLQAFGLGRQETEQLFSGLDEDYFISRFLHFSLDAALAKVPEKTFAINGFPQSHVSLDAAIEEIL